jgi:hypothetical protein
LSKSTNKRARRLSPADSWLLAFQQGREEYTGILPIVNAIKPSSQLSQFRHHDKAQRGRRVLIPRSEPQVSSYMPKALVSSRSVLPRDKNSPGEFILGQKTKKPLRAD